MVFYESHLFPVFVPVIGKDAVMKQYLVPMHEDRSPAMEVYMLHTLRDSPRIVNMLYHSVWPVKERVGVCGLRGV